MFLTPIWFIDTIILLTIAIYLFVKYVSRNHNYWKKKKVFYIEPMPFFGNFYDVATFKVNIGEYLAKLYNSTTEPFFGMYVFGTPHLIIKSPELIKQVLVKDFHNFTDRTIFAGDHEQIAKSMLFLNKNPEWKIVRTKMTPVFTSGKLRGMLPLVNGVGENLKAYIRKNALDKDNVEIKEICAKFSTDVIAKCAFAIDAYSFEDDNAGFRSIGRLLFDFRWSTGIQQTAAFFAPTLSKLFRLRVFDDRAITFMRDAFWNAIKLREASNVKINDLIDAIIELRKNEKFCKEVNFVNDKVVAQAANFFAAGFETSSSTMSFTLYELCLHPHIQRKVREEIKETLEQHGEFTYEVIQQMKYLHMCISEVLRKYPVLPFLDRRCNADYQIPGSDVVIEKGTPVYIPMLGLQLDPQYFPNPQEFNPERFSDENINDIIPFSYMPFGEGPRNCIGERFGMMSTKLGLLHILSEFEVERTSETPVPMVFEPKSFLLASKVGLPMKVKRPISTGA